ncbi:MAG: DUF4185 domain-containing protein [Saprospiraceae bacterium]|nr:DUF4185 domain-containing protein [Saprospiraceae bacterium]
MPLLLVCQSTKDTPRGIDLHTETLKRLGNRGDNWCITWAKDDSQITSMDDGNWLNDPAGFHNNLYRIIGSADDFERKRIPQYPKFIYSGEGWFGYGVCAIGDHLYSAVSRTQDDAWSGPFQGFKLLKSSDNGERWYRVNRTGPLKYLAANDSLSREQVNPQELFFYKESGKEHDGQMAYPFASIAFVQNGKANGAAKDEFVYIYSPEGAQSNELLLARVHSNTLDDRSTWQYFSGWDQKKPTWSSDLSLRQPAHIFPAKNKHNEYFGWYSWLPSVVWNPGLGCYIMVNGGTYGGKNMTNSAEDYYDKWMHTKTGSLGFWYAENPCGPWKEFFYTDYWTVDADTNLTYQPKLSPKWISGDGKTMNLIWSDAMRNEQGKSHSTNYLWNQMKIKIKTD